MVLDRNGDIERFMDLNKSKIGSKRRLKNCLPAEKAILIVCRSGFGGRERSKTKEDCALDSSAGN